MSSLNPLDLTDYPGENSTPLQSGPLRCVLLLVGGHTGRVGSTLLKLLATERRRLISDYRLDFHVTGAVNRRATQWRDPDSAWREDSIPRHGDDWPEIIRRFQGYLGPKLFVDCSASPEIAGHYAEFFRNGIGVVTPNKLGNSGPQERYRELQATAESLRVPYRYETTVGAALPLLSTFADLRASGDRVQRIEAVLSGSLSFIFQRLNHGAAFSTAVWEAQAAGYTEPHPAEDLRAQDSARKLLILLREAGIEWEPERVQVQSLVPPESWPPKKMRSVSSRASRPTIRPGRSRPRMRASRACVSAAALSLMAMRRGWAWCSCPPLTPSPGWPPGRTWCGSGPGAISRCRSASRVPARARR